VRLARAETPTRTHAVVDWSLDYADLSLADFEALRESLA
jgi:hypothetical protein